jgi:hypothetical protein
MLLLLLSLLGCIAQGNTDWYYENWCGKGSGLQYLDDANCVKKFPAVFSRDWKCPVPVLDSIPEGFQRDDELPNMKVDTSSLSKYVTDQ